MSAGDLSAVDHQRLSPLTSLGDGAQAKVYRTAYQEPGRTALAYKEFKAGVRTSLRVDVLKELIRWQDSDPSLLALGAWPLRLVTKGTTVTGFLMQEAASRYQVDLALVRGKQQRRLFEVQHLLNAEHILAERRLQIHDRWRLEFLRDVAESLGRLHVAGVAVGDLSPRNLLASLDGAPRSFLIDCDAVSLHGTSILPQFETPDWEAPDDEKATAATDNYKLGLLAIRLFAGDQSLREPAALERAGNPLVDLAARALDLDRTRRPGAMEWIPALDAAMAQSSVQLPRQRTSASPGQPPGQGRPAAGTAARSPAAQPRSAVPTATRRPGRPVGWVLACVVGLIVLGLATNPSWRASAHRLGAQVGGTATQPTGQAAAQARSMNAVLARSTQDRISLQAGVKALRDCHGVKAANADLAGAMKGRSRALKQARTLDVDQLQDGAQLRSTLVQALDQSQRADAAYVRWGRGRAARGCSKSSLVTGAYSTGNHLSQQAGVVKEQFSALWSPIAARYGYPSYGRNDI